MTGSQQKQPRLAADDPRNRGVYLVLVRRRKALRVKVGALGWFDFFAGWYIYTGKARRSLQQRVRRHWSPRKRVHWHIDYLTCAPGSEPIGAVLLTDHDHEQLDECWTNQRVGAMLDCRAIAPGFGASDCMSGCLAHLWFTPQPISLLELARVSPQSLLLIPQDSGHLLLPAADWALTSSGGIDGEMSHE